MSAFKVLPLKFESLYQNRENSRYKNLGITGLLSLDTKKPLLISQQGLSIIWCHSE
jgi:hypothetical protein